MNENIKALLEKVSEDADLQTKFSQIKDLDEAYALAASVQPGFTKEEFIAEMNKIKKAMEEDLTDEDMARSAGGEVDTNMVSMSVTTATFVASIDATGIAATI